MADGLETVWAALAAGVSVAPGATRTVPWTAMVLAAVAIALAVLAAVLAWRAFGGQRTSDFGAGRAAGRSGHAVDDAAGAVSAVPRWWRWHKRACEAGAVRVLARVSPASARSIGRRLAVAGLDGVLDAARWRAGVVLAAGWGSILGVLLAAAAGFVCAEPASVAMLAAFAASGAGVGATIPVAWLHDRGRARRDALLRQLPFQLDLIVLAIDAGMSLSAAIEQAVAHAPPGALRDAWQRTLSDLRAGRPRAEALQAFADRTDLAATRVLAASLIGALAQGVALGPLLRAQAEQRRHERFVAAETQAMRAPVRMLAPLALCVFPCTFIVLMVPLASRLIEEGWWR